MAILQNFRDRLDGWYSAITGVGVMGTDKRLSRCMGPLRALSDSELSSLFHGDDIAAKIVSALPDEALSLGWTVTGVEPEESELWADECERLNVHSTLRRAAIFSRLYGGGALVLIVDDGQKTDEAQSLPMREDSIRAVERVDFVDRRRLYPVIGLDGMYRLEPLRRGESPVMIHESRLVILRGADTDDEMREQLDGWDYSVLQRVYHVLRDSSGAWDAVAMRLNESSFSKTVIKDLAAMLAAGQESAVKDRLELLNYSRSTARTVILDSEEAYTRDIDNLTGIDDILTMYQSRVAAAADMPITKLWGTSAKGLNATGEGDADDWGKRVGSHRTGYLEPALDRVLEVVALASEGPFGGTPPETWQVEWPELEPMSDRERAEIYTANAQADAIYIDQQVLAPEEVALHRFTRRGYEPGGAVDIDRDEREEALRVASEAAPELEPEEEVVSVEPEAPTVPVED